MQPLPTSSHSSTCSPPLFTVRDFSMSRAVRHPVSVYSVLLGASGVSAVQSPNSFMITAIFLPCWAVSM